MRRTLASRPQILRTEVERQWEGRRYSLVQRFHVSPGVRCDQRLLGDIDSAMRRVTSQVVLHLLRWRGDELRFGGLAVVRLGPAIAGAGPTATLVRAIRGGLLTAGMGGELSLSCGTASGAPVVEARLTGYAPRLPRKLYLGLQEPLHRILIGLAVRRTVEAA